MGFHDKKIEKLISKAEILRKRIESDSAELSEIEDKIKILNFENIEAELKKNDMSVEDYSDFLKKISGKKITFSDIEKMLDFMEEKNEK